MRIGWFIPLPGPFYLSLSGGRRKKRTTLRTRVARQQALNAKIAARRTAAPTRLTREQEKALKDTAAW